MNIPSIRIALVYALASLACQVAFADGATLIRSTVAKGQEAAALSAADVKRSNDLRQGVAVRSVAVVLLDSNALASNIVRVNLPSGEAVEFIKLANRPSVSETSIVWQGSSVDGSTLLATTSGNELRATIRRGPNVYHLESTRTAGYATLTHVDLRAMPVEGNDVLPNPASTPKAPTQK